MRLRYLPAAAAEVDEAVAWYDQQNLGVGSEFAEAVAEAGERAKRHPLNWMPVGKRLRRVRLIRFPYGLLYAPLKTEILIVAVMHDKREPMYWRERMKQIR